MSVSHNFDFLNETVRILILEDDHQSFNLIENILESVPIFRLYHAKTTAEALKILSTTKRIHICLMDLGINDVENDEFYMLRHYYNSFPILIFTGSHSPEKGADSVLFGAKAVIEKKSPFDTLHFLKILNHWALIGILNKGYDEKNWTTLNLATKLLFEKQPESVTEWADILRISDRQLRNLWDSGAKPILHLFHLYYNAFAMYEALFCNESPDSYESKCLKSVDFFKGHAGLLETLTQ